MRPSTFSIGPFSIKAQIAEVKEENIPYKFIRAFKQHLQNFKNTAQVYNLTVNGNGRYYYSPQLNLIGVYILNDFHPSEELSEYVEEIKRHILDGHSA